MNLTSQQRGALGQAALDWVLDYFDRASQPPVYPTVSPGQLDAIVGEPLPQDPQDLAAVVEQFARLARLGRNNGHPRMFGYVQSSGSFAGVAADFLASALNQNVTSWRSAPSATAIEHQAIEWIKELVGFDPAGEGLLVSGGSMANLAAMAVALRASTTADLNARGVAALPAKPRIYASALVHMSIPKAAALLGIGRESVVAIPVDAEFRMDVGALSRLIAADRAAGLHAVCVVANAGDVNTGAIDPLEAIAGVCAAENLWLHVDGSYGGFAAALPSVGTAMAGLGRADSISLDPHKWLFAPLDAGCLVVRNGADLRRAFTHGAAYIDVVADRDMSEFAFWDHGPELSRRFRALKIWFILKCHGARAVRAAIEDNIRLARQLAAAIDASEDFERLAPVPLSIVCFRYRPAHLRGAGDEAALNALNRALMVEVQRDGEAYPSNAMVGSRFALRACIVNFRTSSADVELFLGAIRRVARRIA
ncbi:MAG: aminotransferase class I/II-fold pyridoxal phosphate-dependent enzyme [Vicinamibacterales bacterium]